MSSARARLSQARRWVVKIGSAMITGGGRALGHTALAAWAEQLAGLRANGAEVLVVSSGAVAEGMLRLKLAARPEALHQLQAAAAIGQMGLAQAWERALSTHDLHAAQILLTHDDLSDRTRYLNARSTLRTLLDWGVVPVVNENDTVATEEFRFGDNDTLAALVTNLVEADVLVILTDQAGLYTADPRHDPAATLLPEVRAGDAALEHMASPSGGALGRGGMLTKVRAATRAARSGAMTVIAAGSEPRVLTRLAAAEVLGTLCLPDRPPLAARKQWLAGQLTPKGELGVDAGAARALLQQGRSLLPVGVTTVQGGFRRGDVVRILDPQGLELGRGLVNYGSEETRRIAGQPSAAIEALLGYQDETELIHRNNLVLTRLETAAPGA